MIQFVGAGPGAEDLITVRGAKLLEQADVVVEDRARCFYCHGTPLIIP